MDVYGDLTPREKCTCRVRTHGGGRWDAACADVASRAGATVDGNYSSYNFEQWVNGDDGQDSESHDDDNAEVLAEDKEYAKATANRVPTGPSDCNRGMYVWPSTVGPKSPMRGVAKDGRPRNFANDPGRFWVHLTREQRHPRHLALNRNTSKSSRVMYTLFGTRTCSSPMHVNCPSGPPARLLFHKLPSANDRPCNSADFPFSRSHAVLPSRPTSNPVNKNPAFSAIQKRLITLHLPFFFYRAACHSLHRLNRSLNDLVAQQNCSR